jgi:hypothetical protein
MYTSDANNPSTIEAAVHSRKVATEAFPETMMLLSMDFIPLDFVSRRFAAGSAFFLFTRRFAAGGRGFFFPPLRGGRGVCKAAG